MNLNNGLSLKESYRLLARLPLTDKDDHQLDDLVDQILQLKNGEEIYRLLMEHRGG